MPDLHKLSATEIVSQIKSGKLTSREVMETLLARIDEVNPRINAISQVDRARLLEQADLADAAVRDKKPLGKLHGLPISIKDTCLVAGFTVGKGYPGLFKKAEEDATVIARLKAEGAIILGITNVPELLLAYETDNRTHGRTNNPYNLTCTPGGSSGGEAALLAACGSLVGIGSDAGGSIRQPAHYCGVCAHKPTQGLVPFSGNLPFDGEAGLVTSILTMGPMARHAEDLALLLDVISGYDGLDPYVPPVQLKDYRKISMKGLKVAYYTENPEAPPCPETIAAVEHVINELKNMGAQVEHNFPEELIRDNYKLHWETHVFGGDKAQCFKTFFKNQNDRELTPLLQQFLSAAEQCSFTRSELSQRHINAERFRYDFIKWMKPYDLVITPVAAKPALPHGDTFEHIMDFNYVRLHNLSRCPATVIPVTLNNAGLPIGIQIASKPWHDHVALAAAIALQKKLGLLPQPTFTTNPISTFKSKI